MIKKYILPAAIAGFLAIANIAQAPVINMNPIKPSASEIKNQSLIRNILAEDLRKEIEKEDEEMNLITKEIRLSEKDRVYGPILHAYYNIDVPEYITKRFVRAQIWAESWDYPKAKGKKGERGLMQIMPNTWKGIEPELSFKTNAFNPYRNVYAGVKHLVSLDKELQRRNSKWERLNEEEKRRLIAAAYNCGLGGVIKSHYNIKKVPETTKRYVKNIEKLMSNKYKDY